MINCIMQCKHKSLLAQLVPHTNHKKWELQPFCGTCLQLIAPHVEESLPEGSNIVSQASLIRCDIPCMKFWRNTIARNKTSWCIGSLKQSKQETGGSIYIIPQKHSQNLNTRHVGISPRSFGFFSHQDNSHTHLPFKTIP